MNAVRENLRAGEYELANHVDHDKILRDYDEAMREHERRMSSHRRHVKRHRSEREGDRRRNRSRSRSPKPSMRFRFKSDGKPGHRSSRSKRNRSHDYEDQDQPPRHRTRTRSPGREEEDKDDDAGVEAYAAHPLPRPKHSEHLDPTDAQPASPHSDFLPPPSAEAEFHGPDDAFRSSLFDAMADDEGAAYWEGVYGEPIHVYSRPTVQTETGELEQMSDEQYVDYVKRKMWEKKNPELAKEREDRARREMQEEERRQRKKRGVRDDHDSGDSDYEWVGNEEKGYERRRVRGKATPRERARARPGTSNPGFMSDVDAALARGAKRKEAKKWQQAWAQYQKKWEDLKASTQILQGAELANAIPWPVITGSANSVSKDDIEDFYQNYTLGEGETRSGLLKAERFRWHPDKIQHRFGGENVDADTLKLVTSVFQTIDEMMAREKRKEGRE